jgi:hypothetical protein
MKNTIQPKVLKKFIFLKMFLVAVLLPELSNATSVTVSSLSEYHTAEKAAESGDTIKWAPGIYSDISWVISKDGIIVMAAESGKTVFTGNSKTEILASSIVFSGFQFSGGKVNGDICKVTGSHNLLEHLNFSNFHSKYYMNIVAASRYNTVRYCNFERKPEDVQSSVVQIQVDEKQPGYHVIAWCSFLNHTAPYNAGGDYGIEALRIGYSFQAKFISRTTVEYCYFSRCNGDGEIISSKARENIYRYNTFENNGESHFTLRHGSDNIVYGNFFLGGAGLRIKEGQNHMVYNNYFNTGDYWTIKLENYKADPLKNVVIAHNTFANSGPLKLGGKGDFKPQQVLIGGNLFINPTSQVADDPTNLEIYKDNGYSGEQKISAQNGFNLVKSPINKNTCGYYHPSKKLVSANTFPLLDIPVLNDDPHLLLDIAGNKRPSKRKASGCFEPSKNATSVHPYATDLNTGPVYLRKQALLAKRVIANVRAATLAKAEQMLNEKPVTVTAAFCSRSAGGRHDFYSEGDYWWPDPENPTGPYIQKDGQSNPGNFSDHRHAMVRLSEITATLTSAWMLTGEKKFADKALEHLQAWFVDTATLMNPDMLYAQAIWGRFTGRGIGLIDAYHLVEVAQSAHVLIEDRIIPEDKAEKIKSWFSSFLNWMTTHRYGIDEMNAKNNHGTCWVATASAMAVLVNDENMQSFCTNRFKTVLLPDQMAADGSFPLELRRTKPYGYSLFNIDAMCNVARILSLPDDNLWEYKTPEGFSLDKGMEFIFPFIADKAKWPYAKDIYIWDEWPARQSCLLFAGLAFLNENYIDKYIGLPDNQEYPEVIRNLPVRHPVIWLRNTYN